MNTRHVLFPRKCWLILLCLVHISFYGSAQNVKAYGPAILPFDKIVRDYFFGGNQGVKIFNVNFNGGLYGVGGFEAYGTPFSMQSGMVITTGSVYKINGPYLLDTSCISQDDYSLIYKKYNGDAAFDEFTGADPVPPPPKYDDLNYIDFDFVPSSTSLKLNMIFGSDEYALDFFKDSLDDVPRDRVVYLVYGRGIGNGHEWVNIAQKREFWPDPIGELFIPLTSRNFSNGPKNSGPCYRCEDYNENLGGQFPYISLPGFTNMLTREFNIYPCDTYHVKVGIADFKSNKYIDRCLDSYFMTNAELADPPYYVLLDKYKIGASSYWIDTVAFEDCDYAEIRLDRYTQIGSPADVKIHFGGTAVNGVDYYPLDSNLHFVPNQREIYLKLEAKKTPGGTPDRTVVITYTNEICGVTKTFSKTYFIKKPNLNVNLGPDTVLCEGQLLTLNATVNPAPEYYVWNDFTSGPTKTISKSGYYSVRARIGTCLRSDTIQVFFKPLVKFTLGPDSSICFNDSVKLNPKLALNDTAIHYLWSDLTTKPTLTIKNQNTYWLKVTKNGCSTYDTMQLEVRPLPTIDIGKDTSFCYLGNPYYAIDAITDPTNQLKWNTGATSLGIKVYQSGLYWVSAKGNRCFNYDTIKVTMTQTPPLNLRDTTLCEWYPLKLRAPKGYTYLWNTGSTDSVILTSNAGLFICSAFNGSCKATDSSKVTRLPAPKISLGNDTSLCSGELLTLNATCSTDVVSYLWYGAGSPCGNKATCNAGTTGGYYVKVTSQTNGCTFADTLYFLAKPLPSPNLGPDTGICAYQTINLDPHCTYDSLIWADGSKAPLYAIDKPGDYWVRVFKNSCSKTDTIHAGESTYAPPFTLNHDTGFCKGKSVTYNLTCFNCTYLWDDLSTLPVKTFKSSGQHVVTIDNQICKRSDTIRIKEVIPVSVYPSDTFVCIGKTVVLTNPIPGSSYTWWDGTKAATKIISAEGKYWITISQYGCRFADTMYTHYVGGPVVDLGPDFSSCTAGVVELDATNQGNATYLWSTGSVEPKITVNQGGTYRVVVTRCNSTTSSQVTLDILAPYMKLYVPTAFTPDNNGNNDIFIPGGKIKEPDEYHFAIFNKWGQKVFETTDITKGWDGTSNGEKQPSGVYVWVIDAKSDCYTDPYYHEVGNVTLLK